MPFWKCTTPLSYIGWGKSTQLGYGLGLAMGAKLACPDKLCINVWGDAAIGFTGTDLETAAREQIPILSILLNNYSMAIELPIMPVATEKYRATDITGDYAAFARALGCHGERVTEAGEIVPALKRGARGDRGGAAGAGRVHHREGNADLARVRRLTEAPVAAIALPLLGQPLAHQLLADARAAAGDGAQQAAVSVAVAVDRFASVNGPPIEQGEQPVVARRRAPPRSGKPGWLTSGALMSAMRIFSPRYQKVSPSTTQVTGRRPSTGRSWPPRGRPPAAAAGADQGRRRAAASGGIAREKSPSHGAVYGPRRLGGDFRISP